MIVERINEYLSGKGQRIDEAILADVAALAENAFRRQFGTREEKGGSMRLSSIGRCLRQQAYSLLGVEAKGKEIDSRAKMVFFMGDLTELAILQLARVAGCEILDYGLNQSIVEIDGVQGHPDGVLRDAGGDWLVEVKSMSSYGFAEFERGQLDESYRFQINAYLEGLGLQKAVVVALNKDAGVLAEGVVRKDPAIVASIRDRIQVLKQATLENLPARPYAPNDKGFYPWNCLYCGFYGICLPNAEKVLVGKSYKLKEGVCLSPTSK